MNDANKSARKAHDELNRGVIMVETNRSRPALFFFFRFLSRGFRGRRKVEVPMSDIDARTGTRGKELGC
jgi:hypothetical protein